MSEVLINGVNIDVNVINDANINITNQNLNLSVQNGAICNCNNTIPYSKKIYSAKFSRSGGFIGSFTFLGELKNTTQEEFYMEMSSDGLTWKLLCATNPLIFNSNILHITLVEFPFGFATGLVYGQYANALTGNIYNSTFILTVEFIPIEGTLGLSNFVA